MNADTLLYWLTDRGSGSWQQFKNAVSVLGGERPGISSYVLGSFGYVDFLCSSGARWKICPPALFRFSRNHDAAILTGARTPALVQSLSEEAIANDCEIISEPHAGEPVQIVVRGDPESLDCLAATVRVSIVHDPLAHFCSAVKPLRNAMARCSESRPVNWTPRFFDLATLSWVDGLRPQSACEFTSRFQQKRYFLHARRNRYIPMRRAEAVYAAAAINGVQLASYAESEGALVVPIAASLPLEYACWATLMSGHRAHFENGSIKYTGLQRKSALMLLVNLGQRYPHNFTAVFGDGRRSSK